MLMNIAEKLDIAIKSKEVGTTEGAYVVQYRGATLNKPTYMTNTEWDEFKTAMKNNKVQPYAYAEYSSGDGGEMSEKNGRPPKMASYGSSSRLIYNLSCNKEGFHYEKKLPTTVGGKANLDGFYEDENRYIFVEAKCREPYSHKKNIVSECYAELYEYISTKMGDNLQIDTEPCDKEKCMEIDFWSEHDFIQRFDVKQMICHLLGIATGLIKGTLKRKQIDFIYLFYDPTELDIAGKAKNIIDYAYERTCYECNLIDFSELFRTIIYYLTETKYPAAMTNEEIDEIILKFNFTLESQESYPILIQ